MAFFSTNDSFLKGYGPKNDDSQSLHTRSRASSSASIQQAKARYEAAKNAIELEEIQKRMEILAEREKLELRAHELRTKQRLFEAKNEILEEYDLDTREEIEPQLNDPKILPRSSSLTEYLAPTPHRSSRPITEAEHSQPAANANANPQVNSPLDNSMPFNMPFNIAPPTKSIPSDHDTHSSYQDRNDSVNILAESLAKALNTQRVPIPEPPVFRGNPLDYPAWRSAFYAYMSQLAIPDENKIHYLLKYVGNPASECISCYSLIQSPSAYHEALQTLHKRYGSSFTISEAFRAKLDNFPRVKPHDPAALQCFADFLNQCQTAMRSVNELAILNDPHTHINLCQKLPDYLANKWKESIVLHKQRHGGYPLFADFAQLVRHHAEILNDPVVLGMSRPQQYKSEAKYNFPKGQVTTTNKHTHLAAKHKPFYCRFCNCEGHTLSRCRHAFAKLADSDQQVFIRENKLCWKCLEPGHSSKNCEKPCKCVVKDCGKQHPTSRHDQVLAFKPTHGQSNAANHVPAQAPATPAPQTETKTSNELHKLASTQTVMCDKKGLKSSIIPIWISNPANPTKEHLVYALLDNMSDTTFITDAVADLLNTPHSAVVKLKVNTVNSVRPESRPSKLFKHLDVKGYYDCQKIQLSDIYTCEEIPINPAHIPIKATAENWGHLRNIAQELPDMQNCPVGMLIGYDNAHTLIPLKTICGPNPKDPYAVRTPLGWSIVGATNPDSIVRYINPLKSPVDLNSVTFTCFSKSVKPNHVLDVLQQDFRDCKTTEPVLSVEDKKFMSTLETGITQTPSGFYKMPLPFAKTPNLPNNRSMAMNRLMSLKAKLNKNPLEKAEYINFMTTLLQRGDAESIPIEVANSETDVNYIPHFAVYHPKKQKLRVVFDCAAKFQGTCLNQYLLQGPDLMNRLVGVLQRFRLGQNAVMCDIEKMFHMFKVNEEDRDYLRFLWFADENLTDVVEYRMTVHLFGAKSSPGCANFGLQHLAQDQHDPNDSSSVKAKQFLQNNLYVDDGLLAGDDIPDMIATIKQARDMCSKGNVRLHKFVSNSKEILASIPESEKSDNIKTLDLYSSTLPTERALGVQWCTETDTFKFSYQSKDKSVLPTRRKILSKVASVFDPLGFLSPLVLQGKLILQDVCSGGFDWDDPLDDSIIQRWETWESGLSQLDTIALTRCVYPKNFGQVVRQELHHFCDASTIAYGQCSYLRSINADGAIHVAFLAGKSRVLPIKKAVTIPRAELQAAVLSAKLAHNLKADLSLNSVDAEYFWSDSAVVLGYIHNETRRFQTYVANRVQQIHDLSNPKQWHHVPGLDNPSDIASRGCSIDKLLKSAWFTGPAFLQADFTDRLSDHKYALSDDDPEIKVSTTHSVAKSHNKFSISDRLSKFSSLKSAVNAISLLQSAIHKKLGKPLLTGVTKYQAALHVIITLTQQELLSDDIAQIKSGKVSKHSHLYKLNPFLDKEGVLRVGGRLGNSNMPFDEKHPIILPKQSPLSKLVIEQCHNQVKHQGRGITIAHVRASGFWVIGIRKLAASIIHSCVPCKKSRASTSTQQMAPLPQERTTPSPPFTYVGADCFGPFLIKDGRKELKRYGVLFTCMASRAIHIELVTDMTTDAFINALRRFIAIRGPIRKLYSDRGTNFIGAAAELQVKQFSNDNTFDWEFNTPSSSHMGGVWERQIRSVRSVLEQLLADKSIRLDTEGLCTLFHEAMAIVNCRPLAALDDEMNLLTPNQLLTMKSKVILPPPGDFDPEDAYSRKRWRVVQSLANEFWDAWKTQYVGSLIHRQKWVHKSDPLRVDDIVLVKDANTRRSQWPLARVDQVHPSKDGLIRKVSLVLANHESIDAKGRQLSVPHTIERPVHKLVFLLRP